MDFNSGFARLRRCTKHSVIIYNFKTSTLEKRGDFVFQFGVFYYKNKNIFTEYFHSTFKTLTNKKNTDIIIKYAYNKEEIRIKR